MNLINRDKLIERLEIFECRACRFGGEYCVDCKQIDSHSILNAIDSLPTINEWIPVSERLPEEDGEYLVSLERYQRGKYQRKETFMDFNNGKWGLWLERTLSDGSYYFWSYEDKNSNKVVAWKPIEPYTGGKE